MKAVLLAGGLGTRMREHTEFMPKPMVEIGGKPVLWHIMKLLSSYGIKDFVICAGYKAEYITNYFANYSLINSDFTVTIGNKDSLIIHGDTHDEANWTVTVANTGGETMTGGRIKRIQPFIGDEPFFCTYGDGIADVKIDELIKSHQQSNRLATLTATQPRSRFGIVDIGPDQEVLRFREKPQMSEWVNIGYFIFEPEVFNYIDGDGISLENEPLHRLADENQLSAFAHRGFWQPMDTQREAQLLNDVWANGAPWKRWK